MKEIGKVIGLATPILFMAMGASWIPDMLYSYLSGGKTCSQVLPYIVAGLILFLVGACWAYWQSQKYLPCRVLDRINKIKPRRVLISTLSVRGGYQLIVPDDQDEQMKIVPDDKKKATFTLTGKINEDIKPVGFMWNWQQVLRAMIPHINGNILERVYLIGSSGDPGSVSQLKECKKFLDRYLSDGIKISCEPCAVDFEDIDMLIEHFKVLIKKLKSENYSIEDIMIDTTGGMKTTSIAAAMVTLNNPALHFQYVPTGRQNFKPFSFNVVTQRQGRI